MFNQIGWRIYYGNGNVSCSKDTFWTAAPSEGVQVVIVYYSQTYKIYRGEWQEENYCHLRHQHDYYWMKEGIIGSGSATDVPSGLSDGAVKVGMELAFDKFAAIYDKAKEDRTF